MEKLVADLLVSLVMPADVHVAVRPEGIYIEDAFYAVGPNGVVVVDNDSDDRDGTIIANPAARALIIRITADRDMLVNAAKGKAAAIINFTDALDGKGRHAFISDDIKLKMEGVRILINTPRGEYRINLETYNVTKLMSHVWVIQPTEFASHSKLLIDELHGLLIQANII